MLIGGGILEVSDEKVVLLAESAELPEEIDVTRAKEAKQRAEKRLNSPNDGIDVKKAEVALRRAINRLEVAEQQ